MISRDVLGHVEPNALIGTGNERTFRLRSGFLIRMVVHCSRIGTLGNVALSTVGLGWLDDEGNLAFYPNDKSPQIIPVEMNITDAQITVSELSGNHAGFYLVAEYED